MKVCFISPLGYGLYNRHSRYPFGGAEVQFYLLAHARRRLQHYGFPNVTLTLSPSPLALPAGIGRFECVILSAVYGHMLQHEREQVLPLIWSVIEPGGFLFLNQTPHRYFPFESHTTSLPFINYLPDPLVHAFARACSKRVRRHESWESLLREQHPGSDRAGNSGHSFEQWRPGGDALGAVPGRTLRSDRSVVCRLGKTRYRKTKRLLKGTIDGHQNTLWSDVGAQSVAGHSKRF